MLHRRAQAGGDMGGERGDVERGGERFGGAEGDGTGRRAGISPGDQGDRWVAGSPGGGIEQRAERIVHLPHGDEHETGRVVPRVAVTLEHAQAGPDERPLQPFGTCRGIPEENDPGSGGAAGRRIIDQASN